MINRKTNSMSITTNHRPEDQAKEERKSVSKKGSLTNASNIDPVLSDKSKKLSDSIEDPPKGVLDGLKEHDSAKTMTEGRGRRRVLSKRATDDSVDRPKDGLNTLRN